MKLITEHLLCTCALDNCRIVTDVIVTHLTCTFCTDIQFSRIHQHGAVHTQKKDVTHSS